MAYLLTTRNTCLRLPNHQLMSWIHSGPTKHGNRLAKSLTPSKYSGGTLEVAPSWSERRRGDSTPETRRSPSTSKQGSSSNTAFERGKAPHHGRPVKERGPVSRQRLERFDKVADDGRRGRWDKESRNGDSSAYRKNDIGAYKGKLSLQPPPPPQEPPVYRTEYRKEKDLDFDATAESSEFFTPPTLVTTGPLTELGTLKGAPGRFNSPPLMPGFVTALKEMLGPDAKPTPIQSLSMKWLFDEDPAFEWNQFLLASETGSGKSIAYLLPLLQHIKEAEAQPRTPSSRPLNPRGLILAPTHELSRQLSLFAKSLLHDVKLRVMCVSRTNAKNTKPRDVTASEMSAQFDRAMAGESGEFAVEKDGHPVDIVVGTPMKIMEMIRGRGWDRREGGEEDEEMDPKSLRRGRDKMVGVGKWRSKPELGLENIEWVVVDEADVLLDPDFQEVTRTLLADISAARGTPVPIEPFSVEKIPENKEIEYPFHLVLTSATIPSSLARYLDAYHPRLIRLASPRLHHLPKSLQTEYAGWTGGNKNADIEKRVRQVWAEDALSVATSEVPVTSLSKVLIFCNKSTKVIDLSAFLAEKGIKNVALTSAGEERKRGSNKHLDGFLRPIRSSTTPLAPPVASKVTALSPGLLSDPSQEPHVMITTSLLSRGLDFDPSIKHVFIVDEPRNMIDFLHRAGRSGRAGQAGRVVIFGKTKGRGSDKARDVKQRVRALV